MPPCSRTPRDQDFLDPLAEFLIHSRSVMWDAKDGPGPNRGSSALVRKREGRARIGLHGAVGLGGRQDAKPSSSPTQTSGLEADGGLPTAWPHRACGPTSIARSGAGRPRRSIRIFGREPGPSLAEIIRLSSGSTPPSSFFLGGMSSDPPMTEWDSQPDGDFHDEVPNRNLRRSWGSEGDMSRRRPRPGRQIRTGLPPHGGGGSSRNPPNRCPSIRRIDPLPTSVGPIR